MSHVPKDALARLSEELNARISYLVDEEVHLLPGEIIERLSRTERVRWEKICQREGVSLQEVVQDVLSDYRPTAVSGRELYGMLGGEGSGKYSEGWYVRELQRRGFRVYTV